ncbi:helix-turn-helix domain-containing protein [Clostridium sp. YIM B02505]|uniref:Helix-turn-helix domain-containing protein n=2 Tax=Clostridium yunnanense TaxID=2800325 RepID=A0ABS1EM55_9CLOT|nr:helix-turn-helix domain-containing protein [Clostridium yunnanense]
MMSRTKGGSNRTWTKEEKLRIVRKYFDEGIGRPTLAKEEGISSGMIATWIHKYLNDGEAGLENKKKPGNKFAALHTNKSMNELDRLRLIVAKQEIEIERLKKGYIVKGVGAKKEFVTTKDVSTK